MLDLKHETFIVQIASFDSAAFFNSTMLDTNIYLSNRPQIAGFIDEEAFTKIFNKYVNFADVFFLDLMSKLPKHIKINDHTIKLYNGQQPPYKPIYSLEPVELKTLKAYIETNLANGFIRLSKSYIGAPIFFDQKSNSFFHGASTIEASIALQSRTDICYHWLESRWID